jgi:hypothetical protein
MITFLSITDTNEFKSFCNYIITLGFEFGYDDYIQDFVMPRIQIELNTVPSNLNEFLLISLDEIFFRNLATKIRGWGVSEVFVVLLLIARYKKVSYDELIEWGFKPAIAEKLVSSYPSHDSGTDL